MSQVGETRPQTPEHSDGGQAFFTVVGCMDGRVQDVMASFGREKFHAIYPDTITEAGIVGQIANNPIEDFLDGLKFKLLVSVEKHHSKGILVDGHEECAGNPVDNEKHKEDIRKSVEIIKELVGNAVPIMGVFVKRSETGWTAEEV